MMVFLGDFGSVLVYFKEVVGKFLETILKAPKIGWKDLISSLNTAV